MSEVWVTIGALALATAAIRAAGPVALGGRELPGRLRDAIGLLAPALLAALVMVQTLGAPSGGELELDERVIGVAAAGGTLLAGGSTLLVVTVAALATALARLA